MAAENINVHLKDHIMILEVSRPEKLNALNLKTVDELHSAVEAAYHDARAKGIIITGAGSKAFIAGADIREFASFTPEQGRSMVVKGQAALKVIENCPKPVIAAVNGLALGGGCEVAMACHLRIASANAKFGLPEVKLGVIPAFGGTQRMCQIIGKTRAMELMMTGDPVDAEQARAMGLVNVVTSPDDLMAVTIEMMNRIIKRSPLSVAQVIRCVNAYYNGENGFQQEIDGFTACLDGKEFKEGVSAFIEKREPKFDDIK